METMTIGRVARHAGVNIQTIRYYQRRGLVNEPPKPYHGYRSYSTNAIDRIRFIKRAQRLGFTLREIRNLLEIGDKQCKDIQRLAESKRDSICRQINDLNVMLKILDRYIVDCSNNADSASCAMFEAIESGACCERES